MLNFLMNPAARGSSCHELDVLIRGNFGYPLVI